jgi:hypothetical protein
MDQKSHYKKSSSGSGDWMLTSDSKCTRSLDKNAENFYQIDFEDGRIADSNI